MATHMEVCHAWAHQTGRARKGFNMYYDGDTIYSYGSHFPIAKRINADLYLFTTRSYSVSTSKHKTYTRRAIPNDAEVIYVINPANTDHGRDWDHCIQMARDAIEKSKRARKYADMHLTDAKGQMTNANRLNAIFNLGRAEVTFETLGVVEADMAARIEAAIKAREEEEACTQAAT